jgi:FkbM family methyltransferase
LTGPSSIAGLVDRLFTALVPPPRARLTEGLRQRLRADPLTVADVGAVFGPDPRWLQLGPGTCRFLTFEPDKRSHDDGPAGPYETLALATALGHEKGEATLHLTAGEFASSLYPPNAAALDRFCTWPWHEVVGREVLPVDTLDNCLAANPGWQPDFIKTDVEGADLDVLMGGEGALAGALGVQAEAAFIERNLGTPQFAAIDQFLTAHGFTLFQLLREHWARGNALVGPATRPQIIWADVIYFREWSAVRARVEALADPAAREGLVLRHVVLLLVHGHHDTALDLVVDAHGSGLCGPALAAEMEQALRASARGPVLLAVRCAVAIALAGVMAAVAWPFGKRMRARVRGLYRAGLARAANVLLRQAMRGGLQDGIIADLP